MEKLKVNDMLRVETGYCFSDIWYDPVIRKNMQDDG